MQWLILKETHAAFSSCCLTSCAVQWGLALCAWPDEVLCVGLCTTLMGKVFSYMLELLATPLDWLQTIIKECGNQTSTDNSSHSVMTSHLTKNPSWDGECFKWQIKEYLGVPCGRRFRGLPNRREGCNSGVMDDGKLTECPFVFGTSRCVGLMHTCRRQTFDPRSDFSLRKQSRVEREQWYN